MQPLKAGAAHPNRRAFCAAGEEVQRSADAKANARCAAELLDRVGHHLLLRRADADEGKPRILRRRELRRVDDGAGFSTRFIGGSCQRTSVSR